MNITADPETKGYLLEVLQWITPVVLFFLAYGINALIQRRKLLKEKRLKKEFLITQMELLCSRIVGQKKQNLNCIRRLDTSEERDLRIYRVTGNYIDRIKGVPFKDLFQIFVLDMVKPNRKRHAEYNQEVKKNFSLFQRSIDFLEPAFATLFENSDSQIKEINEQIAKWGEAHGLIIRYKNSLIPEKEDAKDNFFLGFSAILSHFEKQHGNNVQDINLGYRELVLPLIKYSKIHSRDPRSSILMGFLQDSRAAFIQIEHYRNTLRESHIDYTRSIMKEYRVLNRLLEFYK